MKPINNIAIFASGSGSNAEEIIKHFKDNPYIKVCCVLSNKKDAYVHQRAKNYNIPSYSFDNSEIADNESKVFEILTEFEINYIVLAGYLKLIPDWIIEMYPNRILNIHPALLPKFGGKGMYGINVHKAVIAKGEKESGITIHLVNSEYDKGKILFQDKCPVLPDDTPESLAMKIHSLEHRNYPKLIESFILLNDFLE